MNITISTTFMDEDAYNLVICILDAVAGGELTGVNVTGVISTRQESDDPQTDVYLRRFMQEYPTVNLIVHSAKQNNRRKQELGHVPTPEEIQAYDESILKRVREMGGSDLNIQVGDMIIHGEPWCRELPSLNLHPDLPLTMGGAIGMYWEVIAEWVRSQRLEMGGMMHLAIPTLDAGTPVTYYRLPTRGIVNGVNLDPLWWDLPEDPKELEVLIQEQVGLRDKLRNPLFVALRHAEAAFEQQLTIGTIRIFTEGKLYIRDGAVFDAEGVQLKEGMDVTGLVVGEAAIWPGEEGRRRGVEGPMYPRKES